MSDVQLVETSLRDGNQSLWGATGIDTAMTLTIAPVMDRVGFKAIDFTTSTHMGVAVRYKREDPWERIRLMAEATPNTPLQFMSTGFRFIAWDTASPEFMALAFRTLARNGIRRFCLADPMNDVDAQIACARMVKEAGGEFVVVTAVELEPSDSEEKQDDPADPVQADPAQSNPIGSGVDLSRGRPMPMGPSMQVQPQAPLPNSARGKTHGAIVSLRIEMAAYFRRPPIVRVFVS